jgi:hypothetical protein
VFPFAVVFVMVSLLGASPSLGQQIGDIQTGGTAFYTFARPGQNTIRVLVIGGGRSGIYEIGDNLELSELLALSGGGGATGQTKTTVRLYRSTRDGRQEIFEARLKDFIERSAEHPSLQGGDLVQIETVQRQRFGWRDVLRIVTTGLTVVFAVERLVE